MTYFNNLVSTLSEDKKIDLEVERRIKTGWMKWKSLS
jgi:hypothetical protein